MIFPVDYEQRTLDEVRRCTDDLVECNDATISVLFHVGVPVVEFIFNIQHKHGKPMFHVQLVAESRKNPLSQRLIEGDELRRWVRSSVENYFKKEGLTLNRKAMTAHGIL